MIVRLSGFAIRTEPKMNGMTELTLTTPYQDDQQFTIHVDDLPKLVKLLQMHNRELKDRTRKSKYKIPMI